MVSPLVGFETWGRLLESVIVWTPAPGMSKAIVWGPAPPPFASVIAWRSEPAPESSVLITVKVVAPTTPAKKPSSTAAKTARCRIWASRLPRHPGLRVRSRAGGLASFQFRLTLQPARLRKED